MIFTLEPRGVSAAALVARPRLPRRVVAGVVGGGAFGAGQSRGTVGDAVYVLGDAPVGGGDGGVCRRSRLFSAIPGGGGGILGLLRRGGRRDGGGGGWFADDRLRRGGGGLALGRASGITRVGHRRRLFTHPGFRFERDFHSSVVTLLRGDVILRSLPDEHANLGEVHAEPRDDPSLLRVVDAHVPTHGTLEVVDAAFGADRRRPPARREPAQCTRRLLTRILPIRRCIAVGSVLGIGSILGVAQASLESLLRPRRRAVQVPSGGAQFAGDDLRSLAALFLPGRRRLPPGPGRLHVPLGHAWCALEFRAGRRLCVTHVVVLVDGGRSRGFGFFVRVVDGRVLISTVIPVRAFGCHAERGFGGGDGLREPAALLPPRALLLDVLGEVQHLGRRHEADVLRVVKSHQHRLGAIG